ncbi:hypothetical protein MTQ89_01065 [Staphylococcus hyicus]|uniref:hypothetical protein n=1 Tax=Staphylococcus hyicus TaxID=1284 RepID=UPI00208F3A0D|nr:hypothetical protein [Staphylococcus hyicus]MCO4329097.1 hypothetical protein [Staphylococcus hyicus]MCO4335368.1 hypothetical protein [Staphylococcus hyicus]
MIFKETDVCDYIKIVRDANPLHPKIVPGQMVVEQIWQTLKRYPLTYHVKYMKPIFLNETYEVEEHETQILVKNSAKETMLKIFFS